MTTHRIARAFAVSAALALAACSGGPASAPTLARSRSALIVVPPDASFHPFLCTGDTKGDPAGDQLTGGAWRDIVGDETHPAFYRAADDQYIYFRMRVSGDPRKPGSTTELQPSSWDVLVDTDGDLSTYEYMFTADGNLPGGNAVQFVRNSVKEPTDPTDPAMDDKLHDLIADLTPATDYWSVKVAPDGSAFGGDPDYFMTLVLPKTLLASVGVDLTKAFVVWAGTNARTYSLNSDFGCYVGIPPNLGDAGNDPGELDPPDAVDDAVTTPEDTPVNTAVLANDHSIDEATAIAIVSSPAHGTATLEADRTITYSPDPDWFGTDTYTYRVSDTTGDTDTAVVTVTVTPVDDGPPVVVDDTWTMIENTSSAIDVLANDTVIDRVASLTVLAPPASGTAVVNPDHTITYTPPTSFVGTVTFTYQVTDSDGQTGTATVTVTVQPVDSGFPVAVADAFSTPEDTPHTIAVLSNDTVLDLPAVVTLATTPSHGTAAVNADNTVTYTPAANYFGADFFTYQVADREGQPATASVTITVTPVDDGPPIAVADDATTPEDAPIAIAVLANDTVTDGLGEVTILVPPAHGTAAVNPDHTITYTPAPGFNGLDELTYQVSDLDGQTASAPVSVAVTPVDSGAPVARPDAFTTAEDTALPALPVLANDTVLDPPAVVSLATPPAHGTATVNADGTITYAPVANWFGTDVFTYRVTDLDRQSATATVTITVTPVNDGPPVAAADSATTPEGTPIPVAVLANDTVIDGVAAVAILAPPAHGTAVVNLDRTVTYTPAPSWFGVDAFTYQVTDTDGQTAAAPVSVTVTPVDSGAPIAWPDAFTTAEDTPLPSLDVLANDVVLDGPATVSLATPPAHGTAAVNADGTIAYAPAPDYAGPDAFTYLVADRDGQVASATVSIVVTPVGDPPVANPDFATAYAAGPPVAIPVLANDTDADGDALTVTSATHGAHGTVTVLSDGTIQYLPAADFTGLDTFTYVVSDGTSTASTTVSVTVAPPRDSNGDGILDGIGVRGGGCASGPGGAASLLLVGMALVLRRRAVRPMGG